jgi:hypothetical protein
MISNRPAKRLSLSADSRRVTYRARIGPTYAFTTVVEVRSNSCGSRRRSDETDV